MRVTARVLFATLERQSRKTTETLPKHIEHRLKCWELEVSEQKRTKLQLQWMGGAVKYRGQEFYSKKKETPVSPHDIAGELEVPKSKVLGALLKGSNLFVEARSPIPEASEISDLLTPDNLSHHWPTLQSVVRTTALHLLGHGLEILGGQSVLLSDGQTRSSLEDTIHYDALFGQNVSTYLSKKEEDFEGDLDLIVANAESEIKALLALKSLQSLTPPTNESLAQLSKILSTLVSKKRNIERIEIPRDRAIHMFTFDPFKIHHITKAFKPSDWVSVARCENFMDIVDGPVLGNTGAIGGLKVLATHAAGWGQTPNEIESTGVHQPMSRVQAVALPTSKMLAEWEERQAEAERRNHRVIGMQQKLFMIHPLSPGSPFMLPHGTRIAHKLMEVIRAEYVKFSFQEVVTPILFNKDLWVQSGHWENYKDDMFLVSMGNSGPKSDNPHNQNAVERDSHNGGGGCCDHGESEEIHGIKPMNCPAHCLIFKSTDKSYRDLPLRLAEFSPLHRNEASGALSGLSRVRKFHQDDGHIFCTFDQIQSEITSTLQFIDRVYSSILRLPSYYLALATRPASNFIGELEEWDAAEAMLTKALDDSGREWTLKPEDGAFYGPKIDVMVRDALGRVHQTATVQLDFQLPQRFGLIYVDSSGTAQRPVMIHRAVLGSVERMMAMLIEHTAGKWPFWISPRQAVVIPVVMTPEVMTYAESIAEQLRTGSLSEGEIENGVRRPCYFVDMDRSDNTIKKRVLNAQKAKYNFMMVVGQEEVRDRKVSVRGRDGTQLGMKSVAEVRRMFMEFEENFE